MWHADCSFTGFAHDAIFLLTSVDLVILRVLHLGLLGSEPAIARIRATSSVLSKREIVLKIVLIRKA